MAKSRKRDGERDQGRPLAVKPAERRSKPRGQRTRKGKAGSPPLPEVSQTPAASSSSSEDNDAAVSTAETEVPATKTSSTCTAPEANGTANRSLVKPAKPRSKRKRKADSPQLPEVSPALAESPMAKSRSGDGQKIQDCSLVKPDKPRSNRKRKADSPQLPEVSPGPAESPKAKSRSGDGQGNQDRSLAVKPAKPRSKRKRNADAPQLPEVSPTPAESSSSSEDNDAVMSPAETEVPATTTASTCTAPEANGTADLMERKTEFVSYENVDAAGLKSIALGHHGNIMPRHQNLLADIASLIPQMSKTEINDDRSTFLERAVSSYVLYMEWVEPDESVYMWIGDIQGLFKLEIHAVFESNPETLCYKNPLLSFSCGFDNGEHWTRLKHVLEEIFGSSQNKSVKPDCIYAFTRLGETMHFHIYQVVDLEQSSLSNEMKLRKTAPSFAMKPVEVNSGLNCLPIFESKKLMHEEEHSLLNLEHMPGFVPSSGSMIKHMVEHSHIPNILLLPCPRDLSQFNGFNSNLTEFIQRNPATYQDVVRGSSPETTYRDITDPFRVFSRSLILTVGAAIRRKMCIKGLAIDKILLKRGVARLLGVEFIPYTEARALRMFGKIRRILKWCMSEGIPDDVNFVLGLLKGKPLENYNLIADSPVWIPAWDRCHYLEDTYSVFKSDLSFKFQIKFAKSSIRPLIENWREIMEKNSLLKNVVEHNERMPKGYAGKPEEAKAKDREHVKNIKIAKLRQVILDKEHLTPSDKSLCSLLTCQEFFAKCRHSVVHLPEAATVLKLLPMPPETKNFIVTSQFAAAYPLIQQGLCQVMKKTPEELGLTNYFKTEVTSDLL